MIAFQSSDICDCHMHFYDCRASPEPQLVRSFSMPKADAKTYRQMMDRIGISRFVAVQSVAYGFDNSVMMEALANFGESGRAIVVLPKETSRREYRDYDAKGVRGVRAFLQDDRVFEWADLPSIAKQIADLGWHIQLQFDGGIMPDVQELIASLPCDVVIDHIGKYLEPVKPESLAFESLLRLIDTERVWVKLSAPYESSKTGPPHYADIAPLAKSLVDHAPHRMLWGTNFPHPGRNNPPDEAALLELQMQWVGDASTCDQILRVNPENLYRFSS